MITNLRQFRDPEVIPAMRDYAKTLRHRGCYEQAVELLPDAMKRSELWYDNANTTAVKPQLAHDVLKQCGFEPA